MFRSTQFSPRRLKRLVAMAISAFLACGVGSELALAGDRDVTAPPPPACRYRVTVLQSPLMCGGQPESLTPKAINANGDIAGERWCSPATRRPFFIPTSRGYQAWTNPPSGFDISVEGLNSKGEIVGWVPLSDILSTRGYIRSGSGQYTILGTGPGGNWSEAHGLNDSSIVVGFWGNVITGPSPVPCRWDDGVLTDLSATLGAPLGEVNAINSQGQMTGWTGALSPEFDSRAFVLSGDQVTILPATPGANTSDGYAINEHGDVCGRGWLPGSGWRAFAYVDGQMIALGMLPGMTNSIAHAINDAKVVVGSSSNRGFVWQDGTMRNLNDLVPSPTYTVQIAYGIHADGRIIAYGSQLGVGGFRGFLLTPVYPSPADLNGDCHVNGLDLGMLLAVWGPATPPADLTADINHDGVVNGIDLALLLAQWG